MEEKVLNQDKELELDEIIAGVKAFSMAEEEPEEEEQEEFFVPNPPAKKGSVFGKIMGVVAKILIVVLVTVLLVAGTLYGVMYILAKGPSPTARDLFVHSVRETSAVGFLANLFFTEEEIALMSGDDGVEEYIETDTSLVVIPQPTEKNEGDIQEGPQPDAWGLVDEDGDGIIIETVKGQGYSGFMMVILDPSRVIMGSKPNSFGYRGYTVAEMAQEFDAVAAINAGGFEDPNGQGNGSVPNTLVVYEGNVYFESSGTRTGFVGIDSNHILHVATTITSAEIKARDIQYGVCFGPVLVANGEPCEMNVSGVNPRTAIGQRSDGAILMLVIDGRQVISLGATMEDLVDIMMEYGAVNACNLDGGSSSLMWFEGEYVNNCASVIGIRPVPTTFLVLKEGVKDNG